ncbi:hypothetical protein [Niameybacter massiliensis]|uniref:hypothetical protein n=1 Tax=Niameybacter massiliensis TaxID=1658108 RepID=UPI0006B4A761|nr:hypothetical protein [Niameybacter massiliensis]
MSTNNNKNVHGKQQEAQYEVRKFSSKTVKDPLKILTESAQPKATAELTNVGEIKPQRGVRK